MANRTFIHSLIKGFQGAFTTNRFLLPSYFPFELGLGFAPHNSLLAFLHTKSSSIADVPLFWSENVTNLDGVYGLFHRMVQKRPLPSAAKFSDFLDAVSRLNRASLFFDFFKQMCAIGIPVNNYPLILVIKCYSRLYQTEEGFTVLGYCFKKGFVPGVEVYNTFLKGFIHEDNTHEAERLFKKFVKNELCEPDVITYNTMIDGLCKIGNNFTAIALLRLMEGRGCKPVVVTYNTIIQSLCKDIMIDDAFKIFKGMIFPKPNVVTYNSLISALCKSGCWDKVSMMLKQMKDERISPQVKTFNIVVDALCKQGKIKEAEDVINIMIESGDYYPDIVTYNSLIFGYCLRGETSKAQTIFDTLRSTFDPPNADSYNILLDGYCKNGKIDEAIRMNYTIRRKGAKHRPNGLASYIVMIGLWSWIRASFRKPIDEMQSDVELERDPAYRYFLHHPAESSFDDALDLFHFMDDSKLNSCIVVYHILIHRAYRCGRIDIARRLFHDLIVNGLQPDVETYRLMISGLCEGGLLKEAKELLVKMEKSGCRPDGVILNDLIKGYFKKKAFSDAWKILRIMKGRWSLISGSTQLLILDQMIARDPDNTGSA